MERVTPLWLSHHWPEHYDRCAHVGRTHLCRRCLVLYPVLVATATLALAVAPQDLTAQRWWVVAVWLLPLPMVLEWCGEHLLGVAHSPRRLVATTTLAAPGIGLLFAAYLSAPMTAAVLAPALVYGAVCVVAALLGATTRHSSQTPERWSDDHDREERERAERLAGLLAESRADAGDGRDDGEMGGD